MKQFPGRGMHRVSVLYRKETARSGQVMGLTVLLELGSIGGHEFKSARPVPPCLLAFSRDCRLHCALNRIDHLPAHTKELSGQSPS